MKKRNVCIFILVIVCIYVIINTYLINCRSEDIAIEDTEKIFSNFSYIKYFNTKDWRLSNQFSYTKIHDYTTYLSYKDNMIDLDLQITEDTFVNNFALIIILEGVGENKTTFDNYEVENNCLKINLKKDKNIKDNYTGIIILFPRKDDVENVYIERVNTNMNMHSYTNIKLLPKEYLKEDAISDKCVVLNDITKITYNVDFLNSFLEKVENKENAVIRLCHCEEENITSIKDIEYTGQQFNIFYDNSRLVDSSIKYSYNEIYINKITEKTERLMNAEYKCERFIFKDSFGTQSYVEKYIKR